VCQACAFAIAVFTRLALTVFGCRPSWAIHASHWCMRCMGELAKLSTSVAHGHICDTPAFVSATTFQPPLGGYGLCGALAPAPMQAACFIRASKANKLDARVLCACVELPIPACVSGLMPLLGQGGYILSDVAAVFTQPSSASFIFILCACLLCACVRVRVAVVCAICFAASSACVIHHL
jgi:hypothetical protein